MLPNGATMKHKYAKIYGTCSGFLENLVFITFFEIAHAMHLFSLRKPFYKNARLKMSKI